MKIMKKSFVGFAALAVTLFVACDKKPSENETEKVWTSEDCIGYEPDTTSWPPTHPCDSVIYFEFLADSKWDGDTIPADLIRYWKDDEAALRSVKNLSKKALRIWWWSTLSIKGPIDTIPQWIWDFKRLISIAFEDVENLKVMPKINFTMPKVELFAIQNAPSLTEFPDGLWNLPKLNAIWIKSTQISEIPSSISLLNEKTKIKYFELSQSKLKSIPQEFFGIQSLAEVNFDDNVIEELPAEMCGGAENYMYTFRNNRICELDSVFKACIGWTDFSQNSQKCQ